MASGKPVEMTLSEIDKTPKESLPRYIRIKDAVVPSNSYVEMISSKSKTLQGVYYPVYPKIEVELNKSEIGKITAKDTSNIQIRLDSAGAASIYKNTDKVLAKLVIHDTHVIQSDLDSNIYFSSPNFLIEGQYEGQSVSYDVLKLFNDSGLNIDKNAIVLNRGESGMSTLSSILLILGSIFVGLISILTFIPQDKILGLFGINQTWDEYSEQNTLTIEGREAAPFVKRAFSFIIDMTIIYAIYYFIILTSGINSSFLMLMISFIYFLTCDFTMEGSLGKKILKLQVVPQNINGAPLSKEKLVIRNIAKSIFCILSPIFLLALTNKPRLAIHDFITKTMVIEK